MIAGDVLLLFDHQARELARDLSELLEELDVHVRRIECSADLGLTLEGKEQHYLEDAKGAIFLLTPGSERNGLLYPSPSVVHELGQTKQLFRERPRNVTYLVDSRCSVPAIDQRARKEFTAGDAGSVMRALRGLVADLKESGVFGVKAAPRESSTSVALDEVVWRRIPNPLLTALLHIGEQKYSLESLDNLANHLNFALGLNRLHANLLMKDLLHYGVAQRVPSSSYLSVTDLGWRVIGRELAWRKQSSFFGAPADKRSPKDWP